jgi:hypothetical protein
MRNAMLSQIGCIVLFSTLFQDAAANDVGDPFTPSTGFSQGRYDLSEVDDLFLAAFYFKRGLPLANVAHWFELEDDNPVRKNSNRDSIRQQIMIAAQDMPDSLIIQLPKIAVAVEEDNYSTDPSGFFVPVPGELEANRSSEADGRCGLRSPVATLDTDPSIKMIYPDGLQLFREGGMLEQANDNHMNLRSESLGIDSSVAPNECRQYLAGGIGTAVFIPVPTGQTAERFYDLGQRRGTKEWRQNPGVTISLACELTLPLHWSRSDKAGQIDEFSPNEILCPVVGISVTMMGDSKPVFTVEWKDGNYYSVEAPQMKILPATVRPTGLASGNLDDGGILRTPWWVTISDCGSGDSFTHHWRKGEDSVWGRPTLVLKDTPDLGDDLVFNKLSGSSGFEYCTKNPALVGSKAYLTWAHDDQER